MVGESRSVGGVLFSLDKNNHRFDYFDNIEGIKQKRSSRMLLPLEGGDGDEICAVNKFTEIIKESKQHSIPIIVPNDIFKKINKAELDGCSYVIIDMNITDLVNSFKQNFQEVLQDLKKISKKIAKEKEVDIGIAHDRGELNRGDELSVFKVKKFHFAEDDPKKYFEAFMEFAAYGGRGDGQDHNKEAHQKAIKEYWEKLLVKFEITVDADNRQYDTSEIKTKFGINNNEYREIFNNDGPSFSYDELKKYSKRKLQEKEITEERSIYSGKHGFVGKIIDGRLYIKSSKSSEDFDGGLFKQGNGVATIFGDFNVEDIDKITADNIGDIAAQDPRLATAVTAAVRQLQRFQDMSDLNNENRVFGDGSLFLREGDVKRTQVGGNLAAVLGDGGGGGGRPPPTTTNYLTISQPGGENTNSTIIPT